VVAGATGVPQLFYRRFAEFAAEGGYEVDTALYGPATEDIVVEAALALLRDLHPPGVAPRQHTANE
jgi:predicted alpha/beta hydrolase